MRRVGHSTKRTAWAGARTSTTPTAHVGRRLEVRRALLVARTMRAGVPKWAGTLRSALRRSLRGALRASLESTWSAYDPTLRVFVVKNVFNVAR